MRLHKARVILCDFKAKERKEIIFSYKLSKAPGLYICIIVIENSIVFLKRKLGVMLKRRSNSCRFFPKPLFPRYICVIVYVCLDSVILLRLFSFI